MNNIRTLQNTNQYTMPQFTTIVMQYRRLYNIVEMDYKKCKLSFHATKKNTKFVLFLLFKKLLYDTIIIKLEFTKDLL